LKNFSLEKYSSPISGLHSWSDLKYYKSLSYSRHGRTHIFAGCLSILFGIVAQVQQPFEQMFGEGIFETGFYIFELFYIEFLKICFFLEISVEKPVK